MLRDVEGYSPLRFTAGDCGAPGIYALGSSPEGDAARCRGLRHFPTLLKKRIRNECVKTTFSALHSVLRHSQTLFDLRPKCVRDLRSPPLNDIPRRSTTCGRSASWTYDQRLCVGLRDVVGYGDLCSLLRQRAAKAFWKNIRSRENECDRMIDLEN